MRRALAFLTPFGGAARPVTGHVGLVSGRGRGHRARGGGVWWLAGRAWPPAAAAGVALGSDVVCTGYLHLDGLADAADGLLPPMSTRAPPRGDGRSRRGRVRCGDAGRGPRPSLRRVRVDDGRPAGGGSPVVRVACRHGRGGARRATTRRPGDSPPPLSTAPDRRPAGGTPDDVRSCGVPGVVRHRRWHGDGRRRSRYPRCGGAWRPSWSRSRRSWCSPSEGSAGSPATCSVPPAWWERRSASWCWRRSGDLIEHPAPVGGGRGRSWPTAVVSASRPASRRPSPGAHSSGGACSEVETQVLPRHRIAGVVHAALGTRWEWPAGAVVGSTARGHLRRRGGPRAAAHRRVDR